MDMKSKSAALKNRKTRYFFLETGFFWEHEILIFTLISIGIVGY